MTRRYYHKLIRDAVPAKIEANQDLYSVRRVEDAEEFLFVLKAKLREEAEELSVIKTKADFLNEYADLAFVLLELQREFGVSDEEIIAACNENITQKGRFEKRLVLEWSEHKN